MYPCGEFVGGTMNKTNTKRLSAQDMRKLLLKNAKTLMSNKYRTSAPELSGEKKKQVVCS
ncbi:hypothetical protein VAE308_140002 [Vibrio aestuarianus]|uniref:Uncharacterized protein n=1 Tax=Vibrio aestuarianus TaxID=28171 RepID=A0ABM9FLD5_9VIBR|nr:hypothetical protein VAE063_850002 [Vibrio aestuarianus]CAH8231309.1 hypothetical protein VAE308_140002 [Vibrio aestuarianus]